VKRLSFEYCRIMNLPKRDEFPLRVVLALPQFSRMGLESRIFLSSFRFDFISAGISHTVACVAVFK